MLRLVDSADVLIEGWRPGVAERLGLGPDDCAARNPKLVYGRMTGYGQSGPLAQAAGHDINYIALTGALHAIGPADGKPVPPLNLIGDYGGGALYLAFGLMAALFERQRSGRGQVVDAAMVDGASSLLSIFHGMLAAGRWDDAQRGANLLDGGAPFYATYATADGRYVALGALEPKFFAEFAQRIGLDERFVKGQYDTRLWPAMREAIADKLSGAPARRVGARIRTRRRLRGAGADAARGAVACARAGARRFRRGGRRDAGRAGAALLAQRGRRAACHAAGRQRRRGGAERSGLQRRRGAGAARCRRVARSRGAGSMMAADAAPAVGAERPPAPTPRHSASLIVLRDAADGVEVLMLRRAERAGDQNSGAAVFPGGHLDVEDKLAHSFANGLDDGRASALLGTAAGGLDYWVAAIRECFEEAGLLLAVDAAGQWVDLAASATTPCSRCATTCTPAVPTLPRCAGATAGGWPPIACTTSATGSRRRGDPNDSTRVSWSRSRRRISARVPTKPNRPS